MTKEEFTKLPYLLPPASAVACGYSLTTLNKYAENGILVVVLPKGVAQRRFQKRQLAQLLGWEALIDLARWRMEKPLMALGALCEWTGYTSETVSHIVAAGGLQPVQPGGLGERKFRKQQIGEWLGL